MEATTALREFAPPTESAAAPPLDVRTSIAPPPTRPMWRRLAHALLAIVVAIALAATSLYVFTRHNDFPAWYHPDEEGKVYQLLSPVGDRNFRHPLLMLETAERVWTYVGKPTDERDVVIAGRWASALLASIAVFAVSLAAFAGRGWIGLAIVGPTVALCPPLLVRAHYMKEDAALIGGLGVATLGAILVVSTRRAIAQWPAAILLGVGCAAAASGKYVGAAAVAPALLAIVVAPLARWWHWPIRVLLFAAVAVAATVAINWRAFEDPWHLKLKPAANESFEWEYDHGTTGHSGLTLPKPNAYVLRVMRTETMQHVWTIAALGAVAVVARVAIDWRARRRLAHEDSDAGTRPTPTGMSVPLNARRAVVLAAFLLTFVAVLSQNAIPFERYALPVTFFVYVCGAWLAAAGVASIGRPWWRLGVAVVVATTIVLLQGVRCADFNHRFLDDSRQRLRVWLARNVPANAVVVADWFAHFPRGGDVWRFPNDPSPRIRTPGYGFAANSAERIDGLANRGVQYVIAVRPSYARFFEPGIEAIDDEGPGGKARLEQRQRFYRELFDRGRLVWSNFPRPVTNDYVDPEIRVYDIKSLSPSKEPPPPPRPPTLAERYLAEMKRREAAATSRPAK